MIDPLIPGEAILLAPAVVYLLWRTYRTPRGDR